MALTTASAFLFLTAAPLPQAAPPPDAPAPQQVAEDAAIEQPVEDPRIEVDADFEAGVVPEEAGQPQDGPDAPRTIIVTGEGTPGDPLGAVNEQVFEVSQRVDRVLVEPVANIYEDKLPKPVRFGLRNFFRNLREPVNALNYLLQLKPGKAAETLGRFALNSTIGIGGLVDVASREPFNLPYRRNGFSNTLGYYGVGHGPFFVLPLIGSTTLRDLVGSGLDQAIVPGIVGKPFNTPYYAIPAYTVTSLEYRIEYDARFDEIRESVDPYWVTRETYLCERESDIAALKNRPPPRDCSVEALLAAEDARLGYSVEEPSEPTVAEQINTEVLGGDEPSAEPAPEAEVPQDELTDDAPDGGMSSSQTAQPERMAVLSAAATATSLPFENSVPLLD